MATVNPLDELLQGADLTSVDFAAIFEEEAALLAMSKQASGGSSLPSSSLLQPIKFWHGPMTSTDVQAADSYSDDTLFIPEPTPLPPTYQVSSETSNQFANLGLQELLSSVSASRQILGALSTIRESEPFQQVHSGPMMGSKKDLARLTSGSAILSMTPPQPKAARSGVATRQSAVPDARPCDSSSEQSESSGEPMPLLRPLSAYNFFFRDERDRILHGGEPEYTANKAQILLNNHWNQDRTKKRRHRKTHGKIDFTTLSKVISKGWRDLTEDQKQFYRDIAARDWERAQNEKKLGYK